MIDFYLFSFGLSIFHQNAIIFSFAAYSSIGDSIKTKIDDIDIFYDKVGEGRPIILLHGWGANRNTFSKLAKHLCEQFCVYTIDLPGFGETEIGLPLNLDEVAEILYHFCLALKIESPIILGHSYGGRIAIIYASKYPIERLILVSSAGLQQTLTLKKKMKIKVFKMLKRLGIKVKMGSKDYLNADNVRRRMLLDAIHSDLSENLDAIDTETILIYGQKDETTPVSLGRQMEKRIKRSALIEIEQSGHFPYLDQPTIFNLILDSFLASDII